MKTTLDINDDLAKQAKALASKQGTTLRAIIEQGIRLKLDEVKTRKPYRLADKSVQGKGLQSEFQDSTWMEIREAAYEDRGR